MTETTETMQRPPAEPLIEDAGVYAQLAPWGGMAALVIAGAALRVAASVSGHEAEVATGTATAAFVVAVAAAFAARRRFVDRTDRSRVYGWLVLGASWISWATANGVGLGAVALLGLIGAGLSLHWWRKHRIPNAPTAAGELVELVDDYVARWKANLGCKGAKLPGSWLHAPEPFAAGVRYRLELVPGHIGYAEVMGNLDKIREGLQLQHGHDLIAEHHPRYAAPTMQLTIVTRSPIRKDLPWPGPQVFDQETGRITLGPFADGEGCACWRLFTANSMWGGFICGGIGSGKSRTIESICMAATAAGVVVWFADGQGGASSALLKRKADHFAGTAAEWDAMLDAALAVMEIRQDENDAEDLDGFTHTRQRPGLLIVVDECHKVFEDTDRQKKAATIAREGRKVGVVLLAASQVNDLSAFGSSGDAEALRSSLLAGNGILMRTRANSAKGIFSVEVDPRKFPRIPGYGFLIDEDENERSAPYRGWYVTDQVSAAWADRLRWATLDAVAAGYIGPDYTERHARREAARAERRARVEAARQGRSMRQRVTGAVKTATVSAAGYAVLNFPVWDSSKFAPAKKAGGQLSAGHVAVADALADGRGLVAGQAYCRTGTMAAEVGLSERRVLDILKDLTEQGVVRPGDTQGRYYPTGKQLAA